MTDTTANAPPRVPRIRATGAATAAVRALERTHGRLVIVQSAGCCDGSAPMCVPAADFPLGAGDVHVGDVAGVPVYVNRRALAAWRHQDLAVDVAPGYADGLPLAPGPGQHLVSRAEPAPRTTPEPTRTSHQGESP